MSRVKTDPKEIFKEYQKGVSYNTSIDLYETVKRNENFYIGKHWEGLNAPDLEKPTLNFTRRVITYFIAMLLSDDIGTEITPFLHTGEPLDPSKILSNAVERVIEVAKIKSLNRKALRNAGVDGDACFHIYFDPDIETGQEIKGDIACECIDNTNILFGNPFITDVQKQPYLILVQRRLLEDVRAEAEKNGIADLEKIQPDSDSNYIGDDHDNGYQLCTVLIKYWKQQGNDITDEDGNVTQGQTTVWFSKTVENAVIKPPTDTGLHLYPVSFMNWEEIKNQYHGVSPLTCCIDNQISVNRLWAMVLYHIKNLSFPKIIYDASKFPDGYDNGVGKAVAMRGNVNEAITSRTVTVDLSAQVIDVIDKTISMTRDFMGASDAALGTINPDNATAIIATQKASSAPLELQRQAFYQYVEDYVRIIVDMITVKYGIRQVSFENEATKTTDIIDFDFGTIPYSAMDINVNVGAASYWSEMTQLQTLDNFVTKGIVQDMETYIDAIPDNMIRNKQKILDDIRKRTQIQQQPATVAGATPNIQATMGNVATQMMQ